MVRMTETALGYQRLTLHVLEIRGLIEDLELPCTARVHRLETRPDRHGRIPTFAVVITSDVATPRVSHTGAQVSRDTYNRLICSGRPF